MTIGSITSVARGVRQTVRVGWRAARTLLPLAGLLAGMRAQAWAQEGTRVVDSGRFEIRVGGDLVGTEVFAIRAQGAGHLTVGRISAAGGRGESFEVGLTTGRGYTVVRYELRGRTDHVPGIVGVRAGDRVRLTTSGPRGDRVKEFLASPRLLLLEDGVAHHYYFIARRLMDAEAGPGGSPLTALVPRNGRVVRVLIRARTEDTLRFGNRDQSAVRLDIKVAGQDRSIWVDADDGKLLQVLIPETHWRATRIREDSG